MKTLLFFKANWCGPCKRMIPVVEKVTADFEIDVQIIEVTENTEFALEHSITSLPTFILKSDNNEILGTLVGTKNETELREFLSN